MKSLRTRILVSAVALAGAVLPSSAQAGVFSGFGSALTAAQVASTCSASTAPRIWQAFMKFGDPADYWLAPGGDFESGARNWNLLNARVVKGNETAGVEGGNSSLALGAGLLSGAQAVSPPICISAAHPTFRYVFKATGAVGLLSTFIRYRAADGSTQEAAVRSKTATTLLPGEWHPSDLQPLATKLPLAQLGGLAVVQLVFRAPINVAGAGYQIDNVLVDPYRMR